MAYIETIVLKDVANADRTFKRHSANAGTTNFLERGPGGIPIGNSRLSIAQSVTTEAGRRKTTVNLTLPEVQEVTGSNGVAKPTVVRTAYATLTFASEGTATADERGDAVSMLRSLLANNSMWDVIVELEQA